MTSLLSLFDLGASAMAASNAGAATAGRNTANATTAGYAREAIDLTSELSAPLVAGVRTGELSRSSDALLAARERAQAGAGGRANDLVDALGALERQLAPDSGDIPSSIAGLFGSFSALSSSPLDPSLRADVVAHAHDVALAFQRAAHDVAGARADADSRIASLSTSATELAAQIAKVNRAMPLDHDPVLADQRELAAKQLSEIVGGSARIDPDGKMRFVLDGGQVIVDGDRAASIVARPDAARQGHLAIEVVDGDRRLDATNAIAQGRLGAQLSFRDGTALRAADDLDRLAYDLATTINRAHRANAGLDGTTGRDFFAAPQAIQGAAQNLAVSADIDADAGNIATRGAGLGAGDTSGLSALTSLATSLSAGGGTRTFVDESIRAIGAVGFESKDAQAASTLENSRADFLKSLRTSLSGVSPDEEMIRLITFQRAAQAATKFVSTVDEMLDDLIRRI
jgi:flagellar hook-associated protein 1